eukprot:TRINITY_DN1400_c0_g1_i1.p1 TRINITY_DN1400_c0_g1~~TRINITY_DN1400_c0_g1_i1.p1  ORF type:complete len:224 (-),score=53.34 TRINITY_DN1400_c0_g1_i1:26-625(-)
MSTGVPIPGDMKVFVGGLGYQTTPQSLQLHFSQHGEIEEVKLIMDKQTGRSKGFGFVTFTAPEAALRAVANPFPIIDGKQANCNLASTNAKPPALRINQKRPFPYQMGYVPYTGFGTTTGLSPTPSFIGLQEKIIGNHWIVTPLNSSSTPNSIIDGNDPKRRKVESPYAQQLLAQLAQKKEQEVCLLLRRDEKREKSIY